MKTLGYVFALILLATGLQELGAWSNRFVMSHNGDRMPVLVLEEMEGIELMFDARHCPLSSQTKFWLLSDILVHPQFHGFEMQIDESSIGDLMMDLGGAIWVLLPLYPLFLIGRWIRRKT